MSEFTKFWSASLVIDDKGEYQYQLEAPDGTDNYIVAMHLAAMAAHFGYNPIDDGFQGVINLLKLIPTPDPAAERFNDLED